MKFPAMTPLTALHGKWKGLEKKGDRKEKEKEGKHGGMGE